MSRVTSGSRLSRPAPVDSVDREVPAHSWTYWCLGAAALVAFAYVLAFLMAGGA